MKKLISLLFCISITTAIAMAGPQAVVVGYTSPVINIIDIESKEVLWQYEMPLETDGYCNSVKLLEDGEHIAFATTTSAQVVSIKTKEIVWEYRPEGGRSVAEVNSISLLKGGGFTVFVATYPVLAIEVSADFRIERQLQFTELTGAINPHRMFRVVTATKDGNYLVSWSPAGEIYKMNREGTILDRYSIDGAFCPLELSNKHLIFGTGDQGSVIEYNPKTGNIVTEMTTFTNANNGERAWIQYVGECQSIGKDRYMMTNWVGHNKQERHQIDKTNFLPALMIVNGKGEILWHYTMEEAQEILKLKVGATAFHYSKNAIIK